MLRLDKYLVEFGYFESRNRSLDAIKNSKIKVNGKIAKASLKVDENSKIEIEKEKFYVSRAGKKLERFLDEYALNLQNKVALDIGSSTGGFAQILLEKGIKSIYCVDVGSNQLHHSLRDNKKLQLFENCDIRDFRSDKEFDIISCDVSFISILQIIEYIDKLANKTTDIILLYKPQFEVGKNASRDSRGVVVDINLIDKTKKSFEKVIIKLGWIIQYQSVSKLAGKEGNLEYLYHFIKM
jgi:23S rRNA (cytidine1920-2'-O)/16S rRNA (cytidine1409-2'-O)-methyltransferase